MNKVYILIALLIISSSIIYAQTEEWLWAQQAGGSTSDAGYSIATDGDGNSYITGDFYGTATFGSITLSTSTTNYMDSDIFIAKLDTSGNWLWARQAGGSSGSQLNNAWGMGIANDSDGNCYLTGHFAGTVSFGSTSYTTGTYNDYGTYNCRDIFISKLDTIGNWQWTKRSSGSRNAAGYSIAIDSDDNCHVTGVFEATSSFGDTTLNSRGSNDIFIARLDGNGDWLWVKQAGGTNIDYAQAIAVDSSGNSYITGYFKGTAHFGTPSLTCIGDTDIFIAKLDISGDWLWARRVGGTYDKGQGIAIDSDDNCYVTGYFTGSAAFGDYTLTNSGANNWDIFIAKIGIPVSGEDLLPKPPENVQILMDGIDVVISWDAVTQTILDTPIVPDHYLVFFNSSEDIDEPYILLGSSPDLSYTHPGVGQNFEHMFYRVRAYKGRGQIVRDISALDLTPGMTEAEVIRILRGQEHRN